jgi:deazaflavin-dependent oxidoreductase (nitroreductase family)
MITMASTIPAETRLKSNVPSIRVLHTINPFVAAILRSPLHGLLSKQVILLTYTGRKTGKRYTIPVGYARDGETLVVFSSRTWRRNLRGGAPVEVRLQGRRYTGTAVPIEDPEEVAAEVERTMASCGRKGATWRTGITLDVTPPPASGEIAQAMQGRAVIRIRLDGGTGRPRAE